MKKTLLIFTMVVVFSSIIFYSIGDRRQKVTDSAPKNKFQFNPRPTKTFNAKQFKKGKIAHRSTHQNIPHACHTVFNTLLEADLNQNFHNDFKNNHIQSCLNELLKTKHLALLQENKDQCLKTELIEENSSCNQWMYFLRALLVELSINPKKLDELDSTLLFSKIVGSFVLNSNPNQKMLEQNIKISEILLSRDPNLYPAHKAKLMNLFLKELIVGSPEEDAIIETWNQINQFELESDIADFPLMREFIKNQNQPEKLAQYMDDYIEHNPKSFTAHYFKAGMLWKMGDKESAIKWLQKAKKIDPENPDLNYTLSHIENAHENDAIFRITMGLNLSSI